MEITWLGHASIKIKSGDLVIYVDPYAGDYETEDKADLIFITHEHYDHFSKEKIKQISADETIVVGTENIAGEIDSITLIPGEKESILDIAVEAVEAYNVKKSFHPKGLGMGYILTIEGKRIYIAGDTDLIPEMNMLEVDLAFLPCGGTYTMDAHEAAGAATILEPKVVIPIHWGEIVGHEEDAIHLKDEVEKETEIEVKVLKPGESLEF